MEALMKTQKTNSLSPDYSQKSILVVDDVQINYLLIKAILKNTGATVLWADDGFKAIDLIDSGRKIDFVLMDYNMPGMNGYETTKMIKRKRKIYRLFLKQHIQMAHSLIILWKPTMIFF